MNWSKSLKSPQMIVLFVYLGVLMKPYMAIFKTFMRSLADTIKEALRMKRMDEEKKLVFWFFHNKSYELKHCWNDQ